MSQTYGRTWVLAHVISWVAHLSAYLYDSVHMVYTRAVDVLHTESAARVPHHIQVLLI